MPLSTTVTSSELQSHERLSLVALVCASELTSRLGLRNVLRRMPQENEEKSGESEAEKTDKLQSKVIVNTLLTLSLSLCGAHSTEIGLVYAFGNGLSSAKLLPPHITLKEDLRTDFDQKLEFLLTELGARIKRKCVQLGSWLQHKRVRSAWAPPKAQAGQNSCGRLRVTKVFLKSQLLSAVTAAHACNGGFIAAINVNPFSAGVVQKPAEEAARKAVFDEKLHIDPDIAAAAAGEQIVCRLLELEYRRGQAEAKEAWDSINVLQRGCSFKLNEPPPLLLLLLPRMWRRRAQTAKFS